MTICDTCLYNRGHHISPFGNYVYECSKYQANVTFAMLASWGGTESCEDFEDIDEVRGHD